MKMPSRIARVTIALVVANLACWALLFSKGEPNAVAAIEQLSFTPRLLSDAIATQNPVFVLREVGRSITSMFVHEYSYGHVVGNMLFLALFGIAVEQRLGARRFTILYAASGILTAAFYWLIVPDGQAMFGASAAVCGILGAYITLFLKERPLRTVIPVLVLALNVYFAANAHLVPQAGFTFWAHTAGYAIGAISAAIMTLNVVPRQSPPSAQAA